MSNGGKYIVGRLDMGKGGDDFMKDCVRDEVGSGCRDRERGGWSRVGSKSFDRR
jgi:hypothetical protein